MKQFKEYLFEIFDRLYPDQMSLYEMTNLSPKQTGLDQHIWISNKGKAKHGPRVKVSNISGKFESNDSFSVSVEHEPKHRADSVKVKAEQFEKIRDWVKLNHDFLHKVWHSDTMDSQDHMNGIQKL